MCGAGVLVAHYLQVGIIAFFVTKIFHEYKLADIFCDFDDFHSRRVEKEVEQLGIDVLSVGGGREQLLVRSETSPAHDAR